MLSGFGFEGIDVAATEISKITLINYVQQAIRLISYSVYRGISVK